MAKQKTKRIPFANEATEVEPGRWEWLLSGVSWAFETKRGLNVSMKPPDSSSWIPMVYLDKIDQAAIFAEGYTTGRNQIQVRV